MRMVFMPGCLCLVVNLMLVRHTPEGHSIKGLGIIDSVLKIMDLRLISRVPISPFVRIIVHGGEGIL